MSYGDEVMNLREPDHSAPAMTRSLRAALFTEPLGAVPRRALLAVDADLSVRQAIRMMNAAAQGCVLVVHEGRLAGILTERDILERVAAADPEVANLPVAYLMTPDPDTLPASAPVALALHKMALEDYRHIALVNADGTPAGVVGVRDIVVWLVDMFPEAIINLPPTLRFPQTAAGA